jgi:MFS family permease
MNRNIVYILGAIFAYFAVLTMVLILIPLMAASMGVREALIGLIVAIPGLLGLLSVPFGTLSDQIGRKPVMMAGGALGIAAAVLFILSSSVLALVPASILFGLAGCSFIGSALAYVTEASTPETHARIQGYNGATQGLSALFGAFSAGFLVDTVGFDSAFAVVALLGAVMLACASRLEETRGRSTEQITVRRLLSGYHRSAELFATRTEVRMAATTALVGSLVLFSVGNTFLPLYVTRDLGYSAALAGSLLALRNLMSTTVSPVFGRAVGRFGLFQPIFVNFSLAAAALLLMPVGQGVALLFFLLAAQGAGVSFVPASSNVLLTAGTSRAERGLGFASVGLVAQGSILVFPPLLGVLAETFGLHMVFVAGGVLVALCVSGLVALSRRLGDQRDLVLSVQHQT